MKRNEEHLRVVAYLSVKGKDRNIGAKERNQEKVLKEYAKAHNIDIIKIMHRDIQGISVMNYHLAVMINLIKEHEVDGILVMNMAAISTDTEDAYRRVGKVVEAGGTLVSVDEGRLKLPIKTTKEGKLYG